jgi:hypothetical protein
MLFLLQYNVPRHMKDVWQSFNIATNVMNNHVFSKHKTNFVQKPTTKPILHHSTLKEEQFVIYLDKMPSVLQTCLYIFLHIPKPKLFKWPCLQIQKKLQRMPKNKIPFLISYK